MLEEGRESSSSSNEQSKFQSLSKAEKALPSSPNKRAEVVGALAKKYKLKINLLPQKPGPKAQVLKKEKIDWLTEFLDRRDISHITPGRKDHVYTGINVHKRYLRWNLRDIFDILNAHNTLESNERSFEQECGYEISYSSFYEFLRNQKQYILNKKIPQTSCLCKICKKVVLLIKGIYISYTSWNYHLTLTEPLHDGRM